jgi:long-chain acyl-CoA synthetase
VLKPTIFASVPRLWNRLYDKVNATIRDEGGLKQKLFNMGFSSKQDGLKSGGPPTSGFWDMLIFSKLKARLGGRVRLMVTGAAPLSEEVYRFLQIAFCVPVLQGYGLTETAAALTLTRPDDFSTGHVGAPLLSCEVRLADVPEMNYSSKNDPPTGEVCTRGNNVFQGYYKNEAQTNADIKDGWFHTGDVGRWNPNGTLSIIDRKKNIFKLAQGEYVAAEHVEAQYIKVGRFLVFTFLMFSQCIYVQQCFIYGDSLKAELVAIVVPDNEVLLKWAKARFSCLFLFLSHSFFLRRRATRETSRRCAAARRCASSYLRR